MNAARIIRIGAVAATTLCLGASTTFAGSPAARLSDLTTHSGSISIGSPTVRIGGLPAARVSDTATCPLFNGPVPHVGGPIVTGSTTVRINGLPAATTLSIIQETGAISSPLQGAPTVRIGP